MRKVYILGLLLLLVCFINSSYLFAKEIKEAKQDAKLKIQEEPEKVLNEDNQSKLTFRAKKSDLWFQHTPLDEDNKETSQKTDSSTVEVSLEGKLFNPPREIHNVSKKKTDRGTLEGLIASYFSSSKKGDIKWIVENFLEEEQDKVKSLFKDKKMLQNSTSGAKDMKSKYLTGKANYKDYTLIFIEQRYPKGRKVTEALACKLTPSGWRLTSSLSVDETFDTVFAAVSSGEVLDKNANKSESN